MASDIHQTARPECGAPAAGGEPSLLLVAGPSGSGKSTFMEMLRRGELEPSVEAALPSGARDWPQFGGRRKELPTRSDEIVLHYTIIYPRLIGSRFEDDPVLRPFRLAPAATILTIRADPELVLRQFESRKGERARIRGQARTAFRSLRRRIAGAKTPDISSLYRQPGWIEGCYAEWDAFLSAEAASRALTLIDIAPVEAASCAPGFALVRR